MGMDGMAWSLRLLFIISVTTEANATPTLGFTRRTYSCFVAPQRRINDARSRSRPITIRRGAAPEGALSDIVVPSIFNLSDWKNADVDEEEEDSRIWVPQTDCLSFRPLCFCTSQGYYVNILKFTGGGILGRHRHSSPVHAVTLKGSWGYREHGWYMAQSCVLQVQFVFLDRLLTLASILFHPAHLGMQNQALMSLNLREKWV